MPDAATSRPDPDPGTELNTYEVRVHGLLGPLLLSALPHTAALRVPRHTCLFTEEADPQGLAEILALIVSRGLEVESVRETTLRPE